ncbi:hypothetical protein [Nocardia thraciensis]
MASFLASLAAVVIFAAIVYRFAPARGQRAAELFERYRPHAPMSDWSLSYCDDRRQYSELIAIKANRESEAGATRTPGPEKVRSRTPCESGACPGEDHDPQQSTCGIGRGAVQF